MAQNCPIGGDGIVARKPTLALIRPDWLSFCFHVGNPGCISMAVSSTTDNKIYRDHLVETYLKRAGSFRKLLTSLLGFTAAFGFFIAWPYLSAVQKELRLVSEIAQLDADLQRTSAQYDRYQQPREEVQRLKLMIEAGPPMLRDYIETINAGHAFFYPDTSGACQRFMDPAQAQAALAFPGSNSPGQMEYSGPPNPAQMQQIMIFPGSQPPGLATEADSCASQRGDQQLICRIDRFVQFQLCEYEQLFHDQVLPSLAALQDKGTPLFDKAEQQKQFAAVREALHSHVAANPTFWRTYQGKGAMGVRLQDEMERLWADIAERMAPVIENLDQRMQAAHERRAMLKTLNAQLVEQRKELATRLARIQSPIGNLPIGLTESVLLFPIVLAIGFGMASGSLLEQLRLRRALRDAEKEDTGGAGVLSSAELAQIAPLWIELTSGGSQRLARWLLLLTPLLAFAATVITILNTGKEQAASLLQQSAVGDWVYLLLYVASALAFGLYLWLLQRGVRRLG